MTPHTERTHERPGTDRRIRSERSARRRARRGAGPSAGLLALVPLALLAACRAPPLPEGTVESRIAETPAGEFVLGPLDRVHVAVFRHPENSTPDEGALIDTQGRIDLPLVGPLELAGLTLAEAAARIEGELARFVREPDVTLTLLDVGSRRFYLLGEVAEPGARALDRPLSALQALSLGGGFLPGADREKVVLLRGNRADHLEVYFFDARTPGTDGLVAVLPDDVIFVRLSGAGSFRDQLLPIFQGVAPPLAALAGLIVVADSLDDDS